MKVAAPMERVMGIEPTYAAWEAAVLPLNYTRIATRGARIDALRFWERQSIPMAATGQNLSHL